MKSRFTGGVKGEVVVGYRLSRRVNNMAKLPPSLEFTKGDNQKILLPTLYRP
jgi:hypothetical protein